jgi:hypothetical protein
MTELEKLIRLGINFPYPTVNALHLLRRAVQEKTGATPSDAQLVENLTEYIATVAEATPVESIVDVEGITEAEFWKNTGLFSYQNSPSLNLATSLTISIETNSEGFDFENLPNLLSLSFPNLMTVTANGYFWISGNPLLNSVLLPVFESIGLDTLYTGGGHILAITGCDSLSSVALPAFTSTNRVFIGSNAALTNLSLPSFVPLDGGSYNFSTNALDADSVNNILARCVASAGFLSGTLDLSGGTNAAPTGQGVADKATLIARGVTVTTN